MSDSKLWSNPYSLIINDPAGRIVEASFGVSDNGIPVAMLTVWDGNPTDEDSRSIITIHISANSLMEILKEGWEFGEEPPTHWNELCDDDEEFSDDSEGSTH